MATIAVLGLVAPSAMAAVRPAAVNGLMIQPVAPVAPVVAGARLGAPVKGHQNLAGTGLALAIAGVAAAGLGAAAAAGAFDNGHSSSP
jgi:hypothetical protein